MHCSVVKSDCTSRWRRLGTENNRKHELAKAIGVDAGGGVNCACWRLVVELQKWKVNQLMT
jgi:hypothetical protein